MKTKKRPAKAIIVTEIGRYETDKVEAFGVRRHIYKTSRSPFDADDITREILEFLTKEEFDPELDYIVVTGPIILVSLLLATCSANWSRYRILLFDARGGGRYKERIIDHKIAANSVLGNTDSVEVTNEA